jgi:Phage major capsid protein E
MPALDIFSSSAFTMVALTDAINKMPYVPGRIGQLGLFREQGVSTTSVMIEEREGSLNLAHGECATHYVPPDRHRRGYLPHGVESCTGLS